MTLHCNLLVADPDEETVNDCLLPVVATAALGPQVPGAEGGLKVHLCVLHKEIFVAEQSPADRAMFVITDHPIEGESDAHHDQESAGLGHSDLHH